VRFVVDSLERMRGGEVFVPKIPSMNIIDLARAIAPECQTKIVGIRPGEKLHEVMVPEDDAHHTLEYDTYFAIVPPFHDWDTGGYINTNGGQICAPGFHYSSDSNTQWLCVEDLQEMIKPFTGS
jgi:UDP-N-acetylglucosamine 4,6-dehydratase